MVFLSGECKVGLTTDRVEIVHLGEFVMKFGLDIRLAGKLDVDLVAKVIQCVDHSRIRAELCSFGVP